MRLPFLFVAVCLGFSNASHARVLLSNYDSNSVNPTYILDLAGNVTGTFGDYINGVAIDADVAGNVFVASGNNITKFDSDQHRLSQITAPYNIGDIDCAADGTLWISANGGNLYNLDQSGYVLNTIVPQRPASGVATNGQWIYTTTIDVQAQTMLYKQSLDGTVVSSFPVWTYAFGIDYDPADNTFWTFSHNYLLHYGADGTYLTGINVGTLGTMGVGTWVQGIAVAVPEPATGLSGAGVLGWVLTRRKRR